MKSRTRWLVGPLLMLFLLWSWSAAQQTSVVVPRLVNFSGKATDSGKTITGIAGATFAIYKDQYEGSPLWIETQNVRGDTKGNYTVQLGATKPDGLPLDLFTSGEARWLGVTINGGSEQARVLLLSVPYALKAADAETIGGLPPSAFVLAGPATSGMINGTTGAADGASAGSVPPPNSAVTGRGTVSFLPLWDSTSDIASSVLFQSGSGSTAKVGINTKTPASTLDVSGSETVRGNLSLPAAGTATATTGRNSQPTTLTASAFNKTTGTAVQQNFRWQAEPVGNNTTAASGSLNLLYGQGGNPIKETGLQIGSNGLIQFASGQTFPGVGSVTSVGLRAPGSDFTLSGSPVTNNGTLVLNWTVPPSNADTPNAIVKRDATGSFQATSMRAINPSTRAGAAAISGEDDATSTYGVLGFSASGYGVAGYSTSGTAVYGNSNTGTGVFGTGNGHYPAVVGWNAFSTVPGSDGVYGQSDGPEGFAVQGFGTDTVGVGVAGGNSFAYSTVAKSILGTARIGVLGDSTGYGVVASSDNSNAFVAENNSGSDTAVIINLGPGLPLYAAGVGGNLELDTNGNLSVTGAISAGTKDFKIDHPLDPANKYFYHASIESSEMKNMYDGVALLDVSGSAIVNLPDWFEAVNGDFRYQLTPVGAPAPNLHIAQEVADNKFAIAGGQPGMKVSWQITGVRRDAYARAYPIQISVDKPANERGYYIHPELYGAPAEKSLNAAHRARMIRGVKQESGQIEQLNFNLGAHYPPREHQ